MDDNWEEISNQFQEAIRRMEEDQEKYWNSLTKDQQLDAFCCVVRRIREGDLVQKRSYRGVLYDIFAFGPESYMPAQSAGYLDIHNCLYDYDHDEKLLRAFAEKLGIHDPDVAVKEFLNGN